MSQSYANHRRFDPAYHYVAFVLLLACISYAVAHIIHHRPGSWGELLLILLVGIVVVMAVTRAIQLAQQHVFHTLPFGALSKLSLTDVCIGIFISGLFMLYFGEPAC